MIISAVIATSSCNDRNEEQVISKSATNNIDSPWTSGFPALKSGATSADLVLQTEKSSSIFYVITNEDIPLTPEQVMNEAVSPSLPSVVHAAKVDVAAKESSITTIEELKESQSYFTHVVALADGQSVADQAVQKLPFTTAIRQDTSQFFSAHANRKINYLLYKPERVFKDPNAKYPVIFFLGGFGETATQARPINVIQNGLLPEYIHKGNNVPMIVMSVQHVEEVWENELIGEAMDHAVKTLPIDKTKIYLVGTSGGAFGVWNFAQEFPERVSAIVPISGGGDTGKACAMKDLAVWAFTNNQDDLVPPGKSKAMIKAINDCSPKKEAKLKVFPDRGHDCWRRVFDKNHPDWSKSPNEEKVDVFKWLLEQTRPTTN